jgi:hypothetical protein
MKAQINFVQNMNAQAHRKENNFMYSYIGIVVIKKAVKQAVDLRIYGTNSRNYCCLWLNNGKQWAAGSAFAGGYGYHRPSAAAAEALKKAGVTLSEDIDGRGDSAIESALFALLTTMYPNAKIKEVVKAHG